MNTNFSRFAIHFIIATALLSCMNNDKKNNIDTLKNVNTSVTKGNNNSYEPGSDYTLAWADEFDGDSIDSNNWNFQVEKAGRFNDEWQRYTNSSDNAYIENNCLVIKAIHESAIHGKNQYTSARLNTAHNQTWQYGKIVARMKLPYGEGIWPAFWMLGTNINENGGDTPWPQSGEIDIMELFGYRDDAVVEANLHYANKSGKHAMMGAEDYKLKQGKFADAFHTFELEWDANIMTWYVDDQKFATKSITSKELTEFHKHFFMILNIAVGGTFAGRPDTTTNFPQYMYVDWIRVYKKK